MPVALVDFEAEYDGRVVQIRAGRAWVRTGHELVKRYPDRFGPDPVGRAPTSRTSARTSGAASPPTAKPAPRLPELRRDSHPTFRLFLEHQARSQIEREISDMAPHDVETGGYLYSHWPAGAGDVHVCHATGPGPLSRHGRQSVLLSKPVQVEAEFGEFTRRAGLVCVGEWHTHPAGSSNVPSQGDNEFDGDLIAWAHRMHTERANPWVGLIATKSPGLGWMAPRLTAWVMRQPTWLLPSRSSPDLAHSVCEPAMIDGEIVDRWGAA